MRKIFIISVLLSCIMQGLVAASDQPAEAAGTTYTIVIVLPSFPTPETASATLSFLNALVPQAPAGTRLLFYDGPRHQRLAEAQIPQGLAPAGRIRMINRSLGPVFKHLHKTGAVRENEADHLDVPGCTETISSLIKTMRGQTRVVYIGSPYHLVDRDTAATFTRGQCPSVDHILTSTKESPYGTSDIAGCLQNVSIDFLTATDDSSTRERTYCQSFWSLYFSRLGARLTTYLPSPTDVSERCASNATDPVPATKLQPSGALRILQINAIPAATEPATQPVARSAAARPFEKPADLQRTVGVPVAALILIDGSSSMREPLAACSRLSVNVAKLGSELCPEGFELSIIVHRGTGRFSEFSSIIKPTANGGPSEGMAALTRFINEPSVAVERIAGSHGEQPGSPTGEHLQATPFEPIVTFINEEDAIDRALKTLKAQNASRKLLVVLGDAAGSEFDQLPGMSDADRQSEARALKELDVFVHENTDARIVAAFVGPHEDDPSFTDDHAEALRFFQKLAATAQTHGKFTTDLAGLPEQVKRGILNP